MNISIIGTGYVGVVTGACFAEAGHQVTCVDIDEPKVESLNLGVCPIHESGLAELLARNLEARRFICTSALSEGVRGADLIFLTVGTPQDDDGSPNLSALWAVIDQLSPCLETGQILVLKSTVPMGTNAAVVERVRRQSKHPISVASNPEFLKEGDAIRDFMTPDRVVVGVRSDDVARTLRELYQPFCCDERPFLVMSPESAEMTKYVANAILATKISFINEMANLSERLGASINDVRKGIGYDRRIGFEFTNPGPGYGGSCFGKDTHALMAMTRDVGLVPEILTAVDSVNDAQKLVLYYKLLEELESPIDGLTVAIWGLAFKPGTDDIREAPALVLIDKLLEHGIRVCVYDPAALANVQRVYGDRLAYATGAYEAVRDASALLIVTEWSEFRQADLRKVKALMKQPLIIDGRNVLEEQGAIDAGIRYSGIGIPARQQSR